MPYIPIITQSAKTPDVPNAVLDRNRRPTIDTRGIQQGIGQLADASKRPLIDGKAMAGPDAALASIGAAGQHVGAVLADVAQKEQEMTSRVQINRGSDQMAGALKDFKLFQAENKDPLTWEDGWNKIVGPLKETLLSDEKLTPKAREVIGINFDSFSTLGAKDMLIEKRVALTHEAARGLSGNLATANTMRDEGGFKALLASGQKDHLLADWQVDEYNRQWKDEGERQQKQQKADTFNGARNAVTALAAGRGKDEALKMLEAGDLGQYEPAEKEILRNVAQSVDHDRTGEEMDALTEGMDIGAINSPAAVDAWAHGKPHLPPHAIIKAKEYLANRDQAAENEDRIQNGPKNAVALGIEAKDYQRNADPTGERYYELRQQVFQRVPPGLRNSVLDTLEAKFTNKPAPLPEGTKGYVKETLGTTFDPSGGAIPWRTAVPKLNSDGKPVMDTKTGKAKLEWHDDLTAKQRAIDAEATVQRQISDFIRENPNATIPQINKRINELLPNGTRANAIDAARQKVIRQSIQGASTLPEPGLVIPADDILFPR